MTITADRTDHALVAARMDTLDAHQGPRVGDYVRFRDGTLRRCSYHWYDDTGWDGGMQTSDEGRFHLGEYGCSFSGSLYSTVPTDSLQLTDETMEGAVWIFHHDLQRAHYGVDFAPSFRVYTCDLDAPS